MPRKSIPSTTVVQAVRRHFGLQQQELAAYLGVSPELVKHIEAGRRIATTPVVLRLAPLVALLPCPDASAAVAVPEALPAPEPLEARRDFCQYRATNLRRRLRPLEALAAQARRWQQVLPGLLAAADARTQPWLLRRQEQATQELGPEAVAERLLLRLQAEAFETEAATLTELLAVPGLTATQQRTTSGKLRRANDRRDNLTERGQARTGATAFLADVDAEQVAAQVTVLNTAQTKRA